MLPRQLHSSEDFGAVGAIRTAKTCGHASVVERLRSGDAVTHLADNDRAIANQHHTDQDHRDDRPRRYDPEVIGVRSWKVRVAYSATAIWFLPALFAFMSAPSEDLHLPAARRSAEQRF